jgi:3-methyladenine DNA glycosylase/8-oxoguanine DNA glycosylase
MRLRKRASIVLGPRPPFAFDASLHKPDHFPSADNAWEPSVRWQTIRWQGVALGLRLEDRGTVERPAIELAIWSERALPEAAVAGLEAELSYRLGLDLDLAPFYELATRDPHLAPIVERWRGMRPLNVSSLYEYLVIAIVLQNATVRRTVQMMQALLEGYGTPLEYDGRTLYAFWEPAALAAAGEEELRALKLGYRARSLVRVSEAIASGRVDELELRRRPLEEQRAALLSLYGVGPASVGYVLTDVFHRLDELSYISP